MKLSFRSQTGFTLVEVLMSLTCSSMIFAAVLTAGVALQRSFAAVQGYSSAVGDQLRVQDYIALDCRRAIDGVVANNTLTLTLPKYYDGSGNPIAPTLNGTGNVEHGVGTTVISYFQSGSQFIRQVDGVNKAIANNVATFVVTPQDLTSSVSCNITFAPRFTNAPGPAPIAGTTVYTNTFLRNAAARK